MLLERNEGLKHELEAKKKIHNMRVAKRLKEGKSPEVNQLETTQNNVK